MTYTDLTPLGRIVVGILATLAIIAAMAVVGAIETQASPTPISDMQCDSMYHAELIARNTPAHEGIVTSIVESSCLS